MKGACFPFMYQNSVSSTTAGEEIHCAIDEVRFSAEVEGSAQADTKRPSSRQEAPYVVPRFAFVDPISRVDKNIMVPIRGRVPLAFFAWFSELKRQLEDQQKMLEFCRFEEI